MILSLPAIQTIDYFLKRDVTKLYIAVAIRNFGIGLVLIFEPIYLYLHFGNSLPSTFLYFASVYTTLALLIPFAGKALARIGVTKAILLSFLFSLSYYVLLIFLDVSLFLIPLAALLSGIAMALFWPAFHVSFTRLSSKDSRGGEVGRVNVAMFVPVVASPAVGGWILALFGYPVLFTVVLIVFITAAIPLLYSKEPKETYTDSYADAWKRVVSKKNALTNIGFASEGIELLLQYMMWPLFLFLLGISFAQMGQITFVALAASMAFLLYVGKVSDTQDRSWLLGVGAMWTAAAWILKYFVRLPFDALLAHTVYRISRGALSVPFQTVLYERAAEKGEEADEFIMRVEMVLNSARGIFLVLLALVFFLFPDLGINSVFLVGAVLALGVILVRRRPQEK